MFGVEDMHLDIMDICGQKYIAVSAGAYRRSFAHHFLVASHVMAAALDRSVKSQVTWETICDKELVHLFGSSHPDLIFPNHNLNAGPPCRGYGNLIT